LFFPVLMVFAVGSEHLIDRQGKHRSAVHENLSTISSTTKGDASPSAESQYKTLRNSSGVKPIANCELIAGRYR